MSLSAQDELLPDPARTPVVRPLPWRGAGRSGDRRSWWSPRRRGALQLLLPLNLIAAGTYLVWWLLPGRADVLALFVALTAAEALGMFTNGGVWAALSRSTFAAAPRSHSAFTVDVLIPTFGEPLPILRATIAAAITLELPHRTVVLDDAGRGTQRWRLGGDFELRRYEVRSTLVHTRLRPSGPGAGEAVVAAARSFR